MFALNDKVVYPGHGVARVTRVIERSIAGHLAHFYELRFLNKEMIILVPVDNLSSVGIRALSTHDYITGVFKILASPVNRNPLVELSTSSWNKRNKKYQSCLRSGNLIEISKIYRDLHYLAQEKELSFGERNLLLQIELLLAEEISMVEDVGKESAVDQLRSCFIHASPARVKSSATTV
ncbi:MAG: Transcriptional regulator, CarD family [candidate division TM6 bacterium GW2011_GWE2_36_25]|nr:MAG: Transcriptional regulator, CarD family [candidate division TM6 bacterium GW2011_GWF2_36_131]KKQ02361.1 MAG: Transcriptional regulator, CarD family [candidate division TM6 bacterium GW2011_GWE2_36_25]